MYYLNLTLSLAAVLLRKKTVSSLWRNVEALRNMEWKILAKTG